MKSIDKDILGLLCDVGELSARLAGSSDIQAFLGQIVQMIANHLHSDVCSIYLYEEDADDLVLRATVGLNPDSVGRVRMKIGEGLTGLALKELRPICVANASRNPNFKPVAGINEEPYDSYLAVPILKGVEKIGVLVVQRDTRSGFNEQDIMALRATASQMASAIETARILMELQAVPADMPTPAAGTQVPVLIRGQVASKGFAHAPAAIHDPTRSHRTLGTRSFARQYSLDELRAALEATSSQLAALQQRVGQRLPEMASLIFDAHQMMLKDHAFVGEMVSRVEAGENPPVAVQNVARKYADLLIASTHAYIREKAQDVEDLSQRVLANLTGAETDIDVGLGEHPHIIIARELYPSDVLRLVTSNVKGVVLVSGGVTSHVSILARSLQLPLVIAEDPRLLSLRPRTDVLLDAEIGNIYVEPSDEVVRTFHERNRARTAVSEMRPELRETTYTADSQRVWMLANINLLTDMELALHVRAEGVGLYRSEFPFLIRTALPSEEEQFVIYRRLLDQLEGRPLTFRTLDVGGDKLLAYFDESLEENPSLGLRGIRFSLRHREVFEQQIRALLRAAHDSDALKIMFPMISSVEDFQQARAILEACRDELVAAGVPCCRHPKLGMMVEVPSAVNLIDTLAAEADFFCIGTNDLTQFLLAVDRTNEKVAQYFRPYHPAVLRAIRRIADAVLAAGKEISVCGEAAHEERYLPFLLGIGIRTLSVDPQYLPPLQRAIGRLDIPTCQQQAQLLLSETTLAGVSMRFAQMAGSQPDPA